MTNNIHALSYYVDLRLGVLTNRFEPIGKAYSMTSSRFGSEAAQHALQCCRESLDEQA